MKENKFRAYDKEAGCFVHTDKPQDDYFFEFGEDGKLRAYAIDEVPAGWEEPAHGESRELEPVQEYTGRKDKNGKESYEGDIIQGDLFDCQLPTMGKIVFDDHFSFYANKNEAGNTPLHKINKIEIIGNIYGNPGISESHTPTPTKE